MIIFSEYLKQKLINHTVIYQLPITDYQLPITDYQFPITNFEKNNEKNRF